MGSSVRGSQSVRRAQATVIGLILVFGMVIGGSVLIVTLGGQAITETEETLSVQRAEKALTQFDSKAALVALGDTDIQEVSFGQIDGAAVDVENGSGWMLISIENQSSGAVEPKINQTLGAITYEGSDERVAYQGGGVWRRSGNNSVMISPPEFHFRNGTLTLPVVNVSGATRLDGRASIRHAETITKFPNRSLSSHARANPLSNHLVKVTVKSEYYNAWGQYFETRTDGDVEYDHDRNVVNLSLVTPIQQSKIKSASASLAASGSFTVSGAPINGCHGKVFTDSYNSSKPGDYCSQSPGEEGDLVYGNDVDISGGGGNADFHGDVVSGQSVIAGNNINVHGHINYTDSCTDCSSALAGSGTKNQIDGVRTVTDINYFLRNNVENIRGDNDNGPRIVSGTLDFSENAPSDEVTLDSGSYYLEKIGLSGSQTLFLDTSSGDVNLAVRQNVILDDGTEIVVQGSGVARIYVEGVNTGGDPQLKMGKNTAIKNSGNNATRMRVYGQSNFTAVIGGTGGGNSNYAKFTGVIYAPPGSSGTGSITLKKASVYGGLLTGTTTIPNSGRGSIHYDKALREQRIISRNAKVVKITYLHISVNRIYVD